MKVNTIKGEIVCPFCGELNPELKGKFEETRLVNFILDRSGRQSDILYEFVDDDYPEYTTSCCGNEGIEHEEATAILNGEYEVEDDCSCDFDYNSLDDKIEIKKIRKKRINPKTLLIKKLK